ncbi:hypothetical protein FACS1894111_12550 [Clostridia bacterium]|nr:hypothetical protein FACS1894111_12550 [Clostridia bacterium]
MLTTAIKSVAKTAVNDEREPVKLQKRIGSTVYTITVYANPHATETMEQKLLRLVESEVLKDA